eukprot:2082460-Prorocentrum_lima.AAC.1
MHPTAGHAARNDFVSADRALRTCGKSAQWSLAVALFDHRAHSHVQADTTFCNIMMHALGVGGEW